MNRYLAMALLAIGLPAAAQMVDAPEVHFRQGCAMMADNNFIGALDQLDRYQQLTATQYSAVPQHELALLNCAISDLQTGQIDLAEALFAEFGERYQSSPLRAEAAMGLADCAFARRDYGQAVELYQQVYRPGLSFERWPVYDYRLGYAYMKLAEYDQALACFTEAAQNKVGSYTEPYNSAANFYCGYINFVKGDYDKAKAAFAQANPATAPGNMADYYLSQIYYKDGDYTRALAAAKNAIQQPMLPAEFTPQMQRIIGECYYQQGQPAKAIPYLKKYVAAVESPEPSALYIMGLSYYDNGQYQQAIKALEPVTRAQDAMAQSAYMYIGQAALKDDNTDAALMAFNRAVELDIDLAVSEAAMYNYAVAQARGGRMPFASSVTKFEEFLSRYPNSRYATQVQEYIVDGYMTDQNYLAALQSIGRISKPTVKVQAAKQRVLYSLGHQALAAGDNATALTYLKQSDQLSSYDKALAAENALLMGEANYRRGDYEQAATNILSFLNNTGASAQNRPLAYYMLGYTRFQQQRYADAITNFDRALKTDALNAATDADCYNRIGDCRYYQKDFAAALQAYQKAYNEAPAAGDYSLFQQAMMQGYLNHSAKKVELLDQLLAEYPKTGLAPDAMLEKAQTLVADGKNSAAQAAYRALIADYPATSQGRNGALQLGMAYAQDGNTDAAISTYKAVIADYPTSPEAAIAANMLRQVCQDHSRMADYLAFIDTTPTIDPDGTQRAQALQQLVREAYTAGRATDVLNYANQLVESYPDAAETVDILAIKGETEAKLNMGQKAIDTYQRLLAGAQGVEQANTARTGIMRLASDLGQPKLAIEQADALIASSTVTPALKNEALFTRGLAHQQLGDVSSAQADWKTVATEMQDYYGNRGAVYYAQSLFDQQKYPQAQKAATEFINAQPGNAYWLARAFIVLSDALRAQGNEFEANEYLTSLRDNYPGTDDDIFTLIDSRLKK